MLRNEPSQELGDAPAFPEICQDYLHVVHPDTGLDVVFIPGEALPDWLVGVRHEAATHDAAPVVGKRGNKPVTAT